MNCPTTTSKNPKSKQMAVAPDADALALAVACLARKDLFRDELRAKLASRGVDPESVEVVLDWLTEKGALNEERTLISRVETMREAGKASKGRARISEAVHGILAPEDIANDDAELERIRSVLHAKFPSGSDRARAGRFLVSRGFDEDLIETALDRFFPEQE